MFSVPELSAEKKAEIENAWYAQYEWTWYDNGGRCRYYGTYEGYDLIFHQMGDILLDVVGTKVIAGIEFYCGNSFNFYGHRDGKIYEVAELYESGALSKESIAAAAEIHNSEEKTLPLSDEEKKTIQRAWAVVHCGLLWDSEEKQKNTARYYGTYNGYDIVYYVSEVPPYSKDYYSSTIADYLFEFDRASVIFGFRDGEYAFINKLYEDGKLSEESIAQIAKIHRSFESKETK